MGYIIGISFYVLAMLGIGVYVSKKNKTTEDYLVAGRSFGVWFNSSTIVISFVGAIIFFGDVSLAFEYGIWNSEAAWGLIASGGGAVICLILLGKYFGPILWKLKYLSLGDIYYDRFGKACGVVATIVISLTFILWVATNVVIFGKIVETLLQWNVTGAIWVGILVITVYTILGGMFAVAYTDFAQLILMCLGFFVLVPICITQAGGLSEVLHSTPDTMKSIFPQSGTSYVPWIAAWLIIGFGSIPSPDMVQRSFTAKSADVVKKSFYIAAAVILIIEIGVVFVGYTGRVLIDKGLLDATMIADDPELLMPVMIKTLLPVPLAILFFGAVLAGVMGASDSALMALSAMISKNLYNDLYRPNASDKDMIKVTRISVLIIAVIAGIVATNYPHVVELSLYGFDLVLACLFAPLVFGIYFKKANSYGALTAIAIGFGFRTFGAIFTNGLSVESIVYPENWYIFTIVSPILSSVALVVVSLLTQKQSPPLELKEMVEAQYRI